jgi:multisubunit Na+/H+ antiporter MnhF subunit
MKIVILVIFIVLLLAYSFLLIGKKSAFKHKLPILSALNSLCVACIIVFAAVIKNVFLLDVAIIYCLLTVVVNIFVIKFLSK